MIETKNINAINFAPHPQDTGRQNITSNQLFEAFNDQRFDEVLEGIQHNNVDLTALNSTGHTLLHEAVKSTNSEIIQAIISKAGNDPLVLDALDRNGHSPLMTAALDSNMNAMLLLINAGATKNYCSMRYSQFAQLDRLDDYYAQEIATTNIDFLVEAKGDVTSALELAALSQKRMSMGLFARNGADCAEALARVAMKIVANAKNINPYGIKHAHIVDLLCNTTITGNDYRNAPVDKPLIAEHSPEACRALDICVKNRKYAAISLINFSTRASKELYVQYAQDKDIKSMRILFAAGCRRVTAVQSIQDNDSLSIREQVQQLRMLVQLGAPLSDIAVELEDLEEDDSPSSKLKANILREAMSPFNPIIDAARSGMAINSFSKLIAESEYNYADATRIFYENGETAEAQRLIIAIANYETSLKT
jgi:hypothetical protein